MPEDYIKALIGTGISIILVGLVLLCAYLIERRKRIEEEYQRQCEYKFNVVSGRGGYDDEDRRAS